MECGTIKGQRKEDQDNCKGDSLYFLTQISLIIDNQGERVKYCL